MNYAIGKKDSGRFYSCALLCMVAAIFAGLAPIGSSMVAVFLLAGPHNWLEFQYTLSRLPSRWGPCRKFFLFSFFGLAILTIGYLGIFFFGGLLAGEAIVITFSAWYSLMIVWVAGLAYLRSHHNPRRDWSVCAPLTFLFLAAAWSAPAYFGVALVYLHPLIGLWILDREMLRKRPHWRGAYHKSLCLIPVCLVFIWICLGNADIVSDCYLPGVDPLFGKTAAHLGHILLPNVPPNLLLSTNAFLEMVHYGVWILAIPVISGLLGRWNVSSFPVARKSPMWKWILISATICATCVLVVFWAGLANNYATTRDLYFTIAIAHVLAEIPLLLWMI